MERSVYFKFRRLRYQFLDSRLGLHRWAESNGLVLGQLQVEEKSNEITAVPQLLRALQLAGCIVTLDAMGCQKQIDKEILEADADYVLALKGNHETVHEEVKSFLNAALEDAAVAAVEIEIWGGQNALLKF